MKKRRNLIRNTLLLPVLLAVAVTPSVGDSWDTAPGLQSEQSYVELWIGKGCGAYYNDEELVDICFNVHSSALKATITMTNYSPQGESVWIETMPVTTNEVYCIYRTADCPEGLNRISITATVYIGGNAVVLTDECRFFVINCITYDQDKDGYISLLSGGDDCDDSDSSVYPRAQEVCDQKDNDCDGLIDEGLECNFVEIWVDKRCNTYYNDREQVKIYFNVHSSALKATVTITDYRPQSGTSILVDNKSVVTNKVYSLTETAKCPAGVEKLVITATVVIEGKPVTFTDECLFHVTNCRSADNDGDGYNSRFAGGDDCDDDDPGVYPGAAEVCDGKDNNCDGQRDEGFDNDNDGYTTCEGDCDDTDPGVTPRAQEVCDGKDNNCNGQRDEGFTDNDQDGYADCGGDCDDTDSGVNPGASEVQDGKDNDCDGIIDNVVTMDQIDSDQDGFSLAVDCNDKDPSINPGASELCTDGKDNNCNGQTDCSDEGCQDDSACRTGFSLPSFDVSSIVTILNRYKYYLAGGVAGIVAVILVVYLLRRMRREKKEEILPIAEEDVSFSRATEVKDQKLKEDLLDRLEGKTEEEGEGETFVLEEDIAEF